MLSQLDRDIEDMLDNESLHIDARGLPGMFFGILDSTFFQQKLKQK